MYNIIFVGAPGAGKGTQAVSIARKLNLAHIASGNLFRQAVAKGTKPGIQAKSYMDKGLLVPDELTTQMVLERMLAPDSEAGVVLDGFPRNLEQAEALDKALVRQDKTIGKVIYIKVPEEELQKRLGGRRVCRRCQAVYNMINYPPETEGKCDKCGGELYQRPDDTAETIKKRLGVFFAQTAPLIDYYTEKNKLVAVDGEGNIDEVTQRILTALHKGELVTR